MQGKNKKEKKKKSVKLVVIVSKNLFLPKLLWAGCKEQVRDVTLDFVRFISVPLFPFQGWQCAVFPYVASTLLEYLIM